MIDTEAKLTTASEQQLILSLMHEWTDCILTECSSGEGLLSSLFTHLRVSTWPVSHLGIAASAAQW